MAMVILASALLVRWLKYLSYGPSSHNKFPIFHHPSTHSPPPLHHSHYGWWNPSGLELIYFSRGLPHMVQCYMLMDSMTDLDSRARMFSYLALGSGPYSQSLRSNSLRDIDLDEYRSQERAG